MNSVRNIDLNLLTVFEAVYSTGNITRAAEILGVTQPTISNALSRLRERVGDPLFVRQGKGVTPTPRAQEMIGAVRAALQLLTSSLDSQADFDPAASNRHFRMVMLDQLEPVMMPPLVRRIQSFRGVTLEMLHIAYENVMEGLQSGVIDLALAPHLPDVRGMRQEIIGHAKAVMVARRDHPEIDGSISLEQFQSIGQIALIPKLRSMTRIDEYLRSQGISRHITYTSSKFWSFPHLLATTDLIAILPGDFAEEAAQFFPLQILPVPFPVPEQQIYMIWNEDREKDVGLRWLRQQIAEPGHK